MIFLMLLSIWLISESLAGEYSELTKLQPIYVQSTYIKLVYLINSAMQNLH